MDLSQKSAVFEFVNVSKRYMEVKGRGEFTEISVKRDRVLWHLID